MMGHSGHTHTIRKLDDTCRFQVVNSSDPTTRLCPPHPKEVG